MGNLLKLFLVSIALWSCRGLGDEGVGVKSSLFDFSEQGERASGDGYFLLSDNKGRFQVTPVSSVYFRFSDSSYVATVGVLDYEDGYIIYREGDSESRVLLPVQEDTINVSSRLSALESSNEDLHDTLSVIKVRLLEIERSLDSL